MSPTPATAVAGRSMMAEPARAASDAAGSLLESWRRLNTEQRVAAVGALLLVVSTFGPFSFVEAAIALIGIAVLVLLRQRADRKRFHLPMGDGTVILIAALWSAVLIVTRIFDRPLGQSILALGCAAIVAAAGLRERAKRPADDVPEPGPARPREAARPRRGRGRRRADPATVRLAGGDPGERSPDEDRTARLPADEQVQLSLDEPDDPPEFRP